VITRGLIALRNTHTPLITNICQLAGRWALLTLLIGRLGVVAISAALLSLRAPRRSHWGLRC
jgi:putative peptidoglycan lipid II flippase